MSDFKKHPQYKPKGLDQTLDVLTEEMGEVIAALGKTRRWGPDSTNPELPPDQRVTNRDWLLAELDDLEQAIALTREELKLWAWHEEDDDEWSYTFDEDEWESSGATDREEALDEAIDRLLSEGDVEWNCIVPVRLRRRHGDYEHEELVHVHIYAEFDGEGYSPRWEETEP